MSTARPPQPRPGRHRGDQPAAHPGLDDAVVDQLLRGEAISDSAAARLARLLMIAAAPATRDELIHADTVCAAYAAYAHRLRHAATVRSGRPSVPMLALKAAAVAAAATAAGSVAFAASSGIIPTPMNPHPHPAVTQGKASDRPAPSRSSGPARPTPTSAATPSPYSSSSPSASLSPSAAASATAMTADIAGLCAAYQATSPSKREDLLKTPAFAPLVAAAQGAQNVKAYCTPKATTSRHAESKPTASPSGAESSRSPTRQGR